MKKGIVLLLGLALLGGVFVFLNSEGPDPGLEERLEASFQDETLYMEEGVLYLREGSAREEVDRLDDEIEAITWSGDGRYFALDSQDKTYIYLRDGLIFLKEFPSNGQGVFSEDSKKMVLGLKGEENDLAIYNLETKYLDQVLPGRNGEVYLPQAWEGWTISYLEGRSKTRKELVLEENDEDRLMDLVQAGGDPGEIIGLLEKIDREKFYARFGDGAMMEVLDYLKEGDLAAQDSMRAMIQMSDSFVGQEYYKYIEVLGEMYLQDITSFVKALTAFEDRTKDLAYALHDLKLYERPESNLTEDLNMIVSSMDLNPKEKQVGMNLITTYADCGA